MLPTIALGPLHLNTYVLAYGVAFFVGGTLAFRGLLRAGDPPRWTAEGLGLTILVGVIGAFAAPAALALLFGFRPVPPLLHGGSTIFGGMLGGGLAGLAYCRWRRISYLGYVFDLGVVPLPLAQAIGRLGCLGAGCCYGKPTQSWLGMNLPGEGGVWAVRYPTQLISSGCDLLIFLLLVALERHGVTRKGVPGRWPFPGFLFLIYGALYCSKRFALEFLRGDGAVVMLPFTTAHVLSFLGLTLVLSALLWNVSRSRRRTPSSP